jgi:hypothetical protein
MGHALGRARGVGKAPRAENESGGAPLLGSAGESLLAPRLAPEW